MKAETIQFELPKEILETAEKIGFSREKISELSREFVILEVTSNSSKLTRNQAEDISKSMKAASWKKIKKNIGI